MVRILFFKTKNIFVTKNVEQIIIVKRMSGAFTVEEKEESAHQNNYHYSESTKRPPTNLPKDINST